MDDLDRLEAELFKNPKIKAEYDALEPEYALIKQLIAAPKRCVKADVPEIAN